MFTTEEMDNITKVCECDAIRRHQYGGDEFETYVYPVSFEKITRDEVSCDMFIANRINVRIKRDATGFRMVQDEQAIWCCGLTQEMTSQVLWDDAKGSWGHVKRYWYKNGCLTPDLITAYIAIDKTNKENRCLQVLSGSHKCGRIEHIMIGGQTGADPDRLDRIMKICELKPVIIGPGDVLFFHSNLLHTADVYNSPHRRWVFMCAYNLRSNDPVYKHYHPNYTPLEKVPDSAVMDCTNLTDMTGKEFLDENGCKSRQITLNFNIIRRLCI